MSDNKIDKIAHHLMRLEQENKNLKTVIEKLIEGNMESHYNKYRVKYGSAYFYVEQKQLTLDGLMKAETEIMQMLIEIESRA